MKTAAEVKEGYERITQGTSATEEDMELHAEYLRRMEAHGHLYSFPLSELFKNLFKRKTAVITYAIASALVTGYIVALFTQWPITDLLIQIFNISSVGTAIALTPTATFIVFGIALGIGLFLAIKQAIAKNNEIKQNREIAEKYSEQAAELQSLKNAYRAKKAILQGRLAKLDKNSAEYKAWNELGIPDLEKDSQGFIRRYITMWITGAGSGVFIIRSILLTGCIIPLLLGPVSWTLSFAIAMTMGVIWGCFKVMELIQKRELARELDIIKHLPHYRVLYKQYNELLDLALEAAAQPAQPIPNVDTPISTSTAPLPERAALVKASTSAPHFDPNTDPAVSITPKPQPAPSEPGQKADGGSN